MEENGNEIEEDPLEIEDDVLNESDHNSNTEEEISDTEILELNESDIFMFKAYKISITLVEIW